jgi:hypothetical protein
MNGFSPASIVARLNRRFKMRGRTHALSESNVVQRRTCVGSDTPDAYQSLAVQTAKTAPARFSRTDDVLKVWMGARPIDDRLVVRVAYPKKEVGFITKKMIP